MTDQASLFDLLEPEVDPVVLRMREARAERLAKLRSDVYERHERGELPPYDATHDTLRARFRSAEGLPLDDEPDCVSAEAGAPLTTGDVAVFTGAYLRNTGQQVSNAGAERWTVVACECDLCGFGRHVRAVLGEQDRHICRINLRRHNQPSIAEGEAMVEWLGGHSAGLILELTEDSSSAGPGKWKKAPRKRRRK